MKIKEAIAELRNMRKFNYTLAPDEVFSMAITALEKQEGKRNMWVIESDSICNECRHCQFEGDGVSEPILCWREEDSDNFGTTEGCYKYEEFVAVEKPSFP